MGIANCTEDEDYALSTSGAMLFTPEFQHRIDRQELICMISVFDPLGQEWHSPSSIFPPAYANKEYKIRSQEGWGILSMYMCLPLYIIYGYTNLFLHIGYFQLMPLMYELEN